MFLIQLYFGNVGFGYGLGRDKKPSKSIIGAYLSLGIVGIILSTKKYAERQIRIAKLSDKEAEMLSDVRERVRQAERKGYARGKHFALEDIKEEMDWDKKTIDELRTKILTLTTQKHELEKTIKSLIRLSEEDKQ